MSDDSRIRRSNLRRICADRQLDSSSLSERIGSRYSYWRDLLTNEKKSFGEKVARRIEEGLSLPRGWLDLADAPIPDEARQSDPRATLVVADMLNKAPREDRDIWFATILRDIHRNPEAYTVEDRARFEAALLALNQGGTGRSVN